MTREGENRNRRRKRKGEEKKKRGGEGRRMKGIKLTGSADWALESG